MSALAGDEPVRSPCVSVCALDDDGICVGCYRSADEITQWTSLDNAGKRAVVLCAAERARKASGGLR
jgi:predicted Fe-S protein YdhL (DUF1289 family)